MFLVGDDRAEKPLLETRRLTGSLIHMGFTLAAVLRTGVHGSSAQCNRILEVVRSPLSAYNLPWGCLGDREISDLAIRHASTLECLHFSRPREPPFEKVLSLIRSLPRLMDFGMISCSFTETKLEALLDALPSQLVVLDLHNDHVLTGSCDEVGGLDTSRLPLDTLIQGLSKKCLNLRQLDLDFCSQISIMGLDSLLVAIPHIRKLHLQSATLGWEEVSKIFQRCTLLESLSIVSRRLFEEPDTSDEDEVFHSGIQRRSCQKILPRSISQHADLKNFVCAPLRSIRFYSLPHHSVPLESMPLLGLLKDKGQQLRELHAQTLYNTSWHMVSVCCPNLQTLDLSHARAIPYSATGVEEVVLSGLFRILKSIERIGLPCVTDRVLLVIGRSCSKLKELRFEGHASRTGVVHRRPEVTDLGVVAVAEGCPELQVLSLAGCITISVASLRALAFHCKRLKALLLPNCVKINDDAIGAVWPRIGKSLCVLDLVGCKITGKTIRMFYQQVQIQGISLVVLSIARSLSKSAKSELSELSKGLPSLKIVKSMSGLPWDGFFGSPSMDEFIPHQRTVGRTAG
ncbi:hypothetical protein GOP47_0021348 [Adiantum capillus-veneris]|uniref:Uncharacterized protein n=1 Tax=Adiantum capillus-veneris TaxID=13818 RepID=A0A9D4Z7S1_ADICA|nr:hypothetical protein GOP47_0021348 [Adiantum capillus-veneris]